MSRSRITARLLNRASPAPARGDLLRLLERRPIEESGIYAIHLQNPHLSAKVRRFVDFLAERFGGKPYRDKAGEGG